MKLGAIAELKVKDPKVLNDKLLHRIPSLMSAYRWAIELDKENPEVK